MKKIIVLLFAALPLLGWAQDSLYIQKIPNGLCEVHQLYLVRDSEKVLLYEMGDEDGSSIDYEGRFTKKGAYDFECYAIYNNAADGNNFLFYDRLAERHISQMLASAISNRSGKRWISRTRAFC